ncbi:hypothetical protein HJD18_10945 [Thermoleophilia bacterium SCSIO 60948]|nr:hypothetical protein HJD18_10945 [Thermoleophilia bacterium SCSIO 60948]
MRAARNIAILMVLAFFVAVVPGGSNAADALLTLITIGFLAALGLGAYTFYRQQSFTLMTLTDGQRAMLVTALGVLVLMIAGTDQLFSTGPGLLLWLIAVGGAVYALYRVWTAARASY